MRKHKKNCLIGSGVMFVGAIGFLLYAFSNPQANFPWSNGISYMIFILYALLMITLLIVGIKKK